MAVVGAGPAGLAAALAAGDLGCEVTLIDAGSGLGGQMYRPGLLFPGPGPAHRAMEQLPPSLARIRQVRPVRHLAATSAGPAARDRDGVVTLWVGGLEGGAETTVEVRAVVLATGASELVLPFPGWDLPGVTTAGAAQALLKSQGVTVGQRVLVGGSGPLLLPVAASLAEAGVQVVAVLEATPAPAGLPQAAGLAAFPGQLPEATGYAALHHTIGFMPETHMLKPFADRVAAMRTLVEVVLDFSVAQAACIQQLRRESRAGATRRTQWPLRWRRSVPSCARTSSVNAGN